MLFTRCSLSYLPFLWSVSLGSFTPSSNNPCRRSPVPGKPQRRVPAAPRVGAVAGNNAARAALSPAEHLGAGSGPRQLPGTGQRAPLPARPSAALLLKKRRDGGGTLPGSPGRAGRTVAGRPPSSLPRHRTLLSRPSCAPRPLSPPRRGGAVPPAAPCRRPRRLAAARDPAGPVPSGGGRRRAPGARWRRSELCGRGGGGGAGDPSRSVWGPRTFPWQPLAGALLRRAR